MKIKNLFKDIPGIIIKGSKDKKISNITSDSRYVYPNNLFIARKGESVDGSKYIDVAIKSGAIAIVTDVYDPFLKNVVQIIHENPKEIEADIAAKFYMNSSKKLFAIAITGKNGKTTTSFIIKHILDTNEKKCGLIGGVFYDTGKKQIDASLTTPSPVNLQKYFYEMKQNNLRFVCLEATAHAMDQERVKNANIDVAIFSNLTLDHLDYFKTFENYKKAKKKLFDNLKKGSFACINIDDENAIDLVKDSKAKIFSYSINNSADLQAINIKYDLKQTSFDLIYKEKKYFVATNLVGSFNVYNTLAAIAAAILSKIPTENILTSLRSFKTVPGRLERVFVNKPFHVFVDFSHTPDALLNVLKTLFSTKKNRIITVFGCGGDRDKSKRPLMAKATEKYSDISIVTSDNPRSEDPNKIIDEITLGFSKDYKYFKEVDRSKAIEMAIKLAKQNDIVIIAGRGCEAYQIQKNQKIDFDDRKIAKKICDTL